MIAPSSEVITLYITATPREGGRREDACDNGFFLSSKGWKAKNSWREQKKHTRTRAKTDITKKNLPHGPNAREPRPVPDLRVLRVHQDAHLGDKNE